MTHKISASYLNKIVLVVFLAFLEMSLVTFCVLEFHLTSYVYHLPQCSLLGSSIRHKKRLTT